MNPILSKILQQWLNPLSLCIWLIIFSGLLTVRRKKLGVTLLFLTAAFLWVSSTPALSSYLIASLERQYLPIPVSKSPKADAIVILGGCVGAAEYPRIEVDLTDASDRILHAARLYKAGKAPLIIATGGANAWLGTKTPEAFTMDKLLREWGVPENVIVTEQNSLNTHQNAVNTKRLLNQKKLKTILLVTSASHMPRAMSTFRSTGITSIPSPTDYKIVNQEKSFLLSFLPDIGALGGTTLALKEYLGLLVYRWRGWIK
jgi:uncharacterized SAM-binding protein YcdF (DUF218 family)